jgi:hypothetical protein
MGEPTYFIEDVTVTAREAEVTAASFSNGMNLGGSCAPGIGINMNEGAVVGEPQQFTLLDQHGANGTARTAQIGQHIGGDGLTLITDWPGSGGDIGTLPDGVIRFGTPSVEGDGEVTPIGNCTLATLAAGWTVEA